MARPNRFCFRITDHPLGRLLIGGDDILDVASQSGLHGDLVIFLHFDQVRHYAKKARFLPFVVHHLPDAVAVAVVTLGDIFQGLQPGLLPVIGGLADPELLRPSCQILLDRLDLLFILPAFGSQSPDLPGNALQLFQISILLFLLGSGFFLLLPPPSGKAVPDAPGSVPAWCRTSGSWPWWTPGY